MIEKKINEIEDKYKMNDKLTEYILDAVDEENKYEKRFITLSKIKLGIISFITSFVLILVSSMTSILIYYNLENNNQSSAIDSTDYLIEASSYMSEKYDSYNIYPSFSFYINNNYIFNIYEASKDDTNYDYVGQIYSFDNKSNDIVKITMINEYEEIKSIYRFENENFIEPINDEKFKIDTFDLIITIYLNNKFLNEFKINY